MLDPQIDVAVLKAIEEAGDAPELIDISNEIAALLAPPPPPIPPFVPITFIPEPEGPELVVLPVPELVVPKPTAYDPELKPAEVVIIPASTEVHRDVVISPDYVKPPPPVPPFYWPGEEPPERFEHGFQSIRELYLEFIPLAKAIQPFTMRQFIDVVRLRLRHSDAVMEFTIYMTDPEETGSAVKVQVLFVPPTGAKTLYDLAQQIIERLTLQANLLAKLLRTGVRDPRILLEPARGGPRRPGRPSKVAKVPSLEDPALGNTAFKMPVHQVDDYDLLLRPIYEKLSTGELRLTGEYELSGCSGKGMNRVRLERELNYPNYKAEDVLVAVHFFETRGLKCYVQAEQSSEQQ